MHICGFILVMDLPVEEQHVFQALKPTIRETSGLMIFYNHLVSLSLDSW